MEQINFTLDDRVEKAMNDVLLQKESDFRKKSFKPKKKKKTNHWGKVYEQLRDEELKRLGYIK